MLYSLGNSRQQGSRAASSVVTPNNDQLCANVINKIIQARQNYEKSKAAASTGENKALIIHNFIFGRH